jgi:hypothetical protein
MSTLRRNLSEREHLNGRSRRPIHSSRSSKYWVSGYPNLAAEWHPTLNGDLSPRDVSYGSGRRVWWKCPKGFDHQWQSTPNSRTAGESGCPFCAGRCVSATNNLSKLFPAIAAEWDFERNGDLSPSEVLAGSTRRVWWKCKNGDDHVWLMSPHDRTESLLACPFCRGRRASSTNSLETVAPLVAAEWHPTRNGELSPRDFTAGSARKIWWRCRRDAKHEWRASIANRVGHRSGCPICARKRPPNGATLAEREPILSLEWHPTKNGARTPAHYARDSSVSAWWRCRQGHIWRARICSRTGPRRRGCPECRRPKDDEP